MPIRIIAALALLVALAGCETTQQAFDSGNGARTFASTTGFASQGAALSTADKEPNRHFEAFPGDPTMVEPSPGGPDEPVNP